MSYEEKIRQARSSMSKSFGKLADFLLDEYVDAAFMTATELAERLDLDAATVVRFSQYLGYKGFPEMQSEIRDRVRGDLLIRPKQARVSESIPGQIVGALQELSLALEQTRISLDTDQVSKLVEQMGASRRILVLAEGPAQAAAYNITHLLEPGGFRVNIVRQGVLALAQTVYTAIPQDLFMAIEVTGEMPTIAYALKAARDRGIPTAAIVGSPAHSTTQMADVVLSARSHPSLEVRMVTVDAVVYALAQAIRWRFAERFSGAQQEIHDIATSIQEGRR
ncbi:MAG: MurR/RpiR family transcriptional regulator [Chloroflexota bacterium]